MGEKTGKNVVICLDGTGNQFNEDNSNVVTLFRVLRRHPGEQVAYYDPGVGTMAEPGYKTPITKKINKALGLAFGRGVTRNVKEAYSYLMEHYEENDRLYIFGFSRGAYTARALAGFVYHCGLLEKGCQNLIPYAMRLYKCADFKIAARFKKTYARKCKIDLLGLWDTVSTFGWVWDPIFLPHTRNNKSVAAVRHALAIDERRVFFRPNHWGSKTQDVKNVWFAGVHSDVGGGYPEKQSGLAKIVLEWMIKEARDNFGLLIDDDAYRRYVLGEGPGYQGPSDTAAQHESLKGPWWLVEFLPQRERTWKSGTERRVWHFPRPARRRTIKDGSTLHGSVLSRMKAGTYKPRNLPPVDEIPERFEIEAWTGFELFQGRD